MYQKVARSLRRAASCQANNPTRVDLQAAIGLNGSRSLSRRGFGRVFYWRMFQLRR